MPFLRHVNFARDPLHSYLDECQKNEFRILYEGQSINSDNGQIKQNL